MSDGNYERPDSVPEGRENSSLKNEARIAADLAVFMGTVMEGMSTRLVEEIGQVAAHYASLSESQQAAINTGSEDITGRVGYVLGDDGSPRDDLLFYVDSKGLERIAVSDLPFGGRYCIPGATGEPHDGTKREMKLIRNQTADANFYGAESDFPYYLNFGAFNAEEAGYEAWRIDADQDDGERNTRFIINTHPSYYFARSGKYQKYSHRLNRIGAPIREKQHMVIGSYRGYEAIAVKKPMDISEFELVGYSLHILAERLKSVGLLSGGSDERVPTVSLAPPVDY
jgi:hypothetical protein